MIIPAIDLINGKVVRLFQGDYGQKTEYTYSPQERYDLYVSEGAKQLHLVDLDGAKNPACRQLDVIAGLIRNTPVPVQIGGGIRREKEVAGWQQDSGVTIESLIEHYAKYNLMHVLCTDISRDGTLQGSNVELYRDLVRMFPQLEFQASGGIGSLDDLKSLAASGVQSIIIGRSLLEGKFTVKEAVACWPNE